CSSTSPASLSMPRWRETPDCARPSTPVSSVTLSRSLASTRSRRSRASSPSSRYKADAAFISINLYVVMHVWQAGGSAFVDRPRPVVLEQARQRPVGEQAALGLAHRAVVALVRGVDDALHRRAAGGTGQLEAA